MSEQQQRQIATQDTNLAENETEIDLWELAYRLLAHWKMIICVALVCTIITGVVTVFMITPVYEATSVIYVLSRSDSAVNLSDLQLGNALTQDYIKVFNMWEVHEEVISNLNLPYTYKQMAEMISVTNEANTRMLDIAIRSKDPQEAAAIANEYAAVASEYIADTMATDKPNVMSVARVPTIPVSPSLVKNLVLGFALGFLVACAYIALIFITDDKLKTADEIRKYTGLVTLAIIPLESMEEKTDSRRRL